MKEGLLQIGNRRKKCDTQNFAVIAAAGAAVVVATDIWNDEI